MKTADMSVHNVDHMGSDIDVVNAARVSFSKDSKYDVVGVTENYDDNGHVLTRTKMEVLKDDDKRLIAYLARHGHWSPFSHCYAKFRIKAPIFVARQLQKHTVGLAWNEVSRRYVSDEPEFYWPDKWRKAADSVKQGSSDEEFSSENLTWIPHHISALSIMYKKCVDDGMCPEQARMVLPQNMMTEWIWSGSLYAFARVCKLRMDSHTQKETQQIAVQINDCMVKLFPESWKELMK